MVGTPVEAPTRRETIKGGGALVGGGVLAGCAGGSDPSGSGGSNTSNNSNGSGNATGSGSSYEVCMKPNGCHTLDEIPETYAVYDPAITGMMIALGRGEGVVASQSGRYATEYLQQLPGVTYEESGVGLMDGGDPPDKELFYELDADVHLIDPHTAQGYFEFSEADIEELEGNVGPFHGSWMRRQQWTDGHPYYDLYEGLNKYAEVFHVRKRGKALERLYEEMVGEITSQFPPAEERPSVGYLTPSPEEGSAVVIEQDGQGYQYEPFHALETTQQDAFEGLYSKMEHLGGTAYRVGFEVLLEADPEVIIHHNAMSDIRDPEENWYESVLKPMQNHPVAGEVAAYGNDRAYPWHETYAAGPIVMMFETELIAKSLHPSVFGEPTGLEEPPKGEQLFDRQRLADIINGEIYA